MSKLNEAKEELWKAIRSDINWDDGWDSTRSARDDLIKAAQDEVWELIEKVLRAKGNVAIDHYKDDNTFCVFDVATCKNCTDAKQTLKESILEFAKELGIKND